MTDHKYQDRLDQEYFRGYMWPPQGQVIQSLIDQKLGYTIGCIKTIVAFEGLRIVNGIFQWKVNAMFTEVTVLDSVLEVMS